jgi:hypothetical protein
LGPTYLQNGDDQEEEFEGLQNFGGDTIIGATAAQDADVQLDASVERIRLSMDRDVSNDVDEYTSGVCLSAGGT